MATATYRIGPSDFFTPGDLRADAATLDSQVQGLDAVLATGNVPPDFHDSWLSWVTRWNTFRADHFDGFFAGFFAALNDSNRDELISYENQFQQWRSQAAGFGQTPPGPDIEPSEGAGDTLGKHAANQLSGLPSLSSVTWILVAGAVVLLLWRFAK